MSAEGSLGSGLVRAARCRPHMVAVEEKLAAENQQPDPEREAQGPARDARTQQGSANRSAHAANNELHQQLRVVGVREPVPAAASKTN